MGTYSARKYRNSDDPGIKALLDEHMLNTDDVWPSRWVRDEDDLLEWMRESAKLGRWVGVDNNHCVVAHVGLLPVHEGLKAKMWTASLDCDISEIAEIGKLVVHPAHRRAGVSALVTRCCVRQTVELGFIPVATAFASGAASIAMMTSIGWKIVGSRIGELSKQEIVMLTPPQQLVDAALANRKRNQALKETYN